MDLLGGENEGYCIQDLGDQKYFLADIQSPYTNWTYINAIPFHRIFESIDRIKYGLLGVFLVMFAVVILLGVRFEKGITSQVNWRNVNPVKRKREYLFLLRFGIPIERNS